MEGGLQHKDNSLVHMVSGGILKGKMSTLGDQSSKEQALDFGAALRDMTQKEREKEKTAGNGIQISFDGLLGIEISDPIRRANDLIKKKEFAEALKVLAELLLTRENDPDALYLAAYCQEALGEPLQALELLVSVRPCRLSSQLETMVDELTESIRRKMTMTLLLELALGGREGGMQVRHLLRLTELDPEYGTYHFLLLGSLLSDGSVDRAEEAARRARSSFSAPDLQHELQQLSPLLAEVDRRVLARDLGPAVEAYRAGRYKQARAALARLASGMRNDPVVRVFDAYLQELVGGWFTRTRTPAQVEPNGDSKVVERLHFLLVGQDLLLGKAALGMEDYATAEAAFRHALALAPSFPYANYLLSIAAYNGLGERMVSGSPVELDELIDVFREVESLLQVAKRDPDIADSAEQQLGLVRVNLAGLEQALARNRDVALVNGLIDKISSIMESAQHIASPSNLDNINRRLVKLGGEVDQALRSVKDADGIVHLKNVRAVVTRNLEQIQAVNARGQDVQRVNALSSEFIAVMEMAKGGIDSPQQLMRIHGVLRDLESRVERAQREVRGEEGKEALSKLLEAIRRNRAPLDDIVRRIR